MEHSRCSAAGQGYPAKRLEVPPFAYCRVVDRGEATAAAEARVALISIAKRELPSRRLEGGNIRGHHSEQIVWPRQSTSCSGVQQAKSMHRTPSPQRGGPQIFVAEQKTPQSVCRAFSGHPGVTPAGRVAGSSHVLLQLLWAFLNASVCKRCPPPLGLRRLAGCCCLISAVAPELDVTGYIDGRAAAAGTLASPADHLKSLMNSAAKALASQQLARQAEPSAASLDRSCSTSDSPWVARWPGPLRVRSGMAFSSPISPAPPSALPPTHQCRLWDMARSAFRSISCSKRL